MAGSISLSLSQQFDPSGKPYGGAKVYFIQAGTTGTPQNAFQDLGLTQAWSNPFTLLDDGRIPQLYFADGYIKVRITDKNFVQIFNQDNIPVVGPSSGGGGGGGVDPTTVLQTGWLQPIYGTGVVTGFVRANGKTLGNASSGATERANADTAALFAFLYLQDANLAVSGGRGVSAAADYAANKTIGLPDFRGRVLAGLDDMGNSTAGRLTSTYFGSTATVLGVANGAESERLTIANIDTFDPHLSVSVPTQGFLGGSEIPGTVMFGGNNTGLSGTPTNTTGTLGSSLPHTNVQPTILATIYLKL